MPQQKINRAANRRAFLGKVTGAAALLSVGLSQKAAAADALIPPSFTDADPDAWFDGVKGKRRMVFDCTEPKEVFPFAWPKIFVMTNAATGSPAGDCTAVVV